MDEGTNLYPSHKWEELVRHPNTTRADAMYAFKMGEPLDYNPYEPTNPKHAYWNEGYDLAKADSFHWKQRGLNLLRKKDGR